MPLGQDPVKGDPLVSCYFEADFGDHLKNVRFTEISGINAELAVVDHKIISQKGIEVVRKVPGRTKWGDITMKRGITSEMDVYEWRQKVVEGKVDKARTNGTIKMLEHDGNVAAEWQVTAAWPSKINGPSLKSDGDEIAMEEITICYEYIERTK